MWRQVEIFGERDQLPSRAAVVHTQHLRFTEWLAGGSFSAGASFLLEIGRGVNQLVIDP